MAAFDIAFNPPQFGEEYDGVKMRMLVEDLERLHSILTADTDDEGVTAAVDTWNTRTGDVVPEVGDYAAIAETYIALQTFNNGISVDGSIIVTGNVDGRDVSVDGTAQDNHIADVSIHREIAAGLADGDMLYWDQTGTQWLASTGISWSETTGLLLDLDLPISWNNPTPSPVELANFVDQGLETQSDWGADPSTEWTYIGEVSTAIEMKATGILQNYQTNPQLEWFDWSPDGLHLVNGQNNNDQINTYDLDTAFHPGFATPHWAAGWVISNPAVIRYVRGGSHVLTTSGRGDIDLITCDAPYEITTQSTPETVTNATLGLSDQNCFMMSGDGNYFLITAEKTGVVYMQLYATASPYVITGMTLLNELDIDASFNNASSIRRVDLSEDGLSILMMYKSGADRIYLWTMSSAFDVSTATLTGSPLNLDTDLNAVWYDFNITEDANTIYSSMFTTNPGNDDFEMHQWDRTVPVAQDALDPIFVLGDPVYATQIDGLTTSITSAATDVAGTLDVVGYTTITDTIEAEKVIAGDPGLEGTGVTVNGVTYESVLKASDIGGANAAQFIMHRHSTTLPSLIIGVRSKSDTDAHTVMADNDHLLNILAAGWDGVDSYSLSSEIRMEVDGTPGANDMPGQITFLTSADGTETPLERMRIRADGTVEFGDNLSIYDTGVSSKTDIKDGAGTEVMGIFPGDGGHIDIDNYNLWINEEQYLYLTNAGAAVRCRINTSTDGRLNFSAESPAGVPAANFDYPIELSEYRAAPTGITTPHANLWAASWSASIVGEAMTGIKGSASDRSFTISNQYDLLFAYQAVYTATNPGTRLMQFDNATLASITEMYVNDSDYADVDQGWYWAMANVGDILLMNQPRTEDCWVHAEITSITDNTGWWTIGLTVLDDGGGTFVNVQHLKMTLVRQSLIADVPEVNDLTAAVTWDNIPIANVPTGTSSVTVALGDHLHTGVYALINGDITNLFAVNTLLLENVEDTDISQEGEFGFDKNDSSAEALLGSYTTNPVGVYIHDGDGAVARIWTNQNFSGTEVSDWETAFGWGDHAGLYNLYVHPNHSGDVTSVADGAQTIVNGAVTNLKMADMVANTVKVRTVSTGEPQDLAVSANTVFGRAGAGIIAAQLVTGQIQNDNVTYAKIQNVAAANSLLGSLSAAGIITELTGTQVNTFLPNFTSALDGLAPLSGGGSTNYLRADGTWAEPPGSGGLTEVKDDTSPQLGGDLDTNLHNIDFSLNAAARFGAAQEVTMLYNGTDFYVDMSVGSDFILRGENGSETMIRAYANAAVDLYYNNVVKLSTTATGIDVVGSVQSDTGFISRAGAGSAALELHGDAAAFIDFSLDGSGATDSSGRLRYYTDELRVENMDFQVDQALNVTGAISGSNIDDTNWDTAYTRINTTGEFSVTFKRNIAQYNRFGAVQDMMGSTDWDEGIYGGYTGMTNGPTGMTYDPFLVMGSASDVRSFLVVPRTASRGLAYHGSSATGTHAAWHYAGWTTTAADADMTLYPKKGSTETISGTWTHSGNINIDDGVDILSISATSGTVTFQPTGSMNLVDFNINLRANQLTMQGDIILGDGHNLTFGAGVDGDIYSNGTDWFFDAGTGADIQIRVNNSETAFLAVPNGASSLYHNGGLEFRTQQHEGSSITSGAEVYDHAGTMRDVGFNHVKEIAVTATVELSNLHAGNILRKSNSGTYDIDMAASTTEFPVGSMCTVINHGTGGSLTIDNDLETMYVLDGSGSVSANTGFVLAVGGIITIWRQGTSVYYVWGAGIP